jgi:hypothetical protein
MVFKAFYQDFARKRYRFSFENNFGARIIKVNVAIF